MTSMEDLQSLARLYRGHLVEDVLGWWFANGPDDEHGGVLTCWDNAMTGLVSTDKYTWSQGRWVWLLARLAESSNSGLIPVDAQQCLDRAVATAEFVADHALMPDGTTAFVTDQVGTPREPSPGDGLHTSIFADFFAILGFAALGRITGEDRWIQLSEKMFLHAADRVNSGPVRTDPYPIPVGYRAFSLPMIVVGTGTEVYRATRSNAVADIVRSAAATLSGPDFRHDDDLIEMAGHSPDGLLSRHRTPGHALEAMWFMLDAAETVPGVPDPLPWLPGAALRSLRIGWDTEFGGLLRYTDVEGGQPRGDVPDDPYARLVVDTWDTKLWWPQIEALYTTTLLAVNDPSPELWQWRRRLHDYIFATFPAGAGREWIQIRDRQNSPLNKTVALPVKDPFHISRSLLLLVELLS